MMNSLPKPDSNPPVDDIRGHQHYTELCALATSGTLTDDEWRHLRVHLAASKAR